MTTSTTTPAPASPRARTPKTRPAPTTDPVAPGSPAPTSAPVAPSGAVTTTASASPGSPGSAQAHVAPANEVRLVGRISAVSGTTTLPSGSTVVTFRLVVPRIPDPDRPRRVDTIDVACWDDATQSQVSALGLDAQVEVVGSLRRRFFRTANGPASRYEVEAARVMAIPPDSADGPPRSDHADEGRSTE